MRTLRSLAIGIVVSVLSCVIALSPALAYFGSNGSGSGSAATGTLQAPTAVMTRLTGADVSVTWIASRGPLEPTGYLVSRISADGVVTAACGSSRQSVVTSTSCTDIGADDGVYSYVVTALYRSWTAPSAPSAPVSLAAAARLTFAVNPSDASSNVAIAPAVTVAVATGDGTPVRASGTAVTLAVGLNPADGILAGTLTALTDSSGTATFSDLSIDAIGTGYTLVATSGALLPATSDAFTITVPPLAGPVLGRAATYSVLGSADTNTGMTTISGDVGAFPTVTVTGFSDGTVQGETHAGDAAAEGAQLDLVAAYDDLARRVPDTEFAGDQAGAVFQPGIHHTGAAFALSADGVVTLDAQNDPNAVFIFQVGGALNTAAGSMIQLINGAQASQVFWQSDGAAGTGANSSFSGTIISNGAITLGAGGLLIGRALAMRAATTLAHNTIRFTAALPPSIDINGGVPVTTSTRAPVISGTTTAMAGSGISLTFGSQTLVTTVGVDGVWSVASSVIGPGTFTAFVRVRDAAGNAATAAQSVTVE